MASSNPPPPPIQCSMCDKTFPAGEWELYREHQRLFHPELYSFHEECTKSNALLNNQLIQCTLCGTKFPAGKWEQMKEHDRVVHKKKGEELFKNL